MRTVEWNYDNCKLRLIDQRKLPGEYLVNEYDHYQDVAAAIHDMVVRGAPAIGVTAAFSMALSGYQSSAKDIQSLRADYSEAAEVINHSRPTAVNLSWATRKILEHIDLVDIVNPDDLRQSVLTRAQELADEDVAINKRMAEFGSGLIHDGDFIIHHCNTGSLAAVDWGTALGVIRMAHEQGKKVHVLVDETRPRLQGARLTAWELSQYGIPYDIISDNSAGYFLETNQVNVVFFGADRVAANGDVANKIGTYMLALAAFDNQVPVFAVVPTSTIDVSLTCGEAIPIEERDPQEVLNIQIEGKRISPEGATARNPAFDITPNRLLSGIVTENGIVYPPFLEKLRKVVDFGFDDRNG